MQPLAFYIYFFALLSTVTPDPSAKTTLSKGGCGFNDNLLVDDKRMSKSKSGGGGSGGFNFGASKLWDTNKLSYKFEKVRKEEKNQIRGAMDIVEKNTCIRFVEVHDISSVNRYVNITNYYDPKEEGCGCDCIHGDVKWHTNDPNVTMSYTSRFDCDYKWLVLHELGHVLGLAHTQRRYDRDDHIIFNKECVNQTDYALLQYEKFEKNQLNTYNMSYKCNSLMHYPAHWNTNKKKCITMLPKTEKCLEEGIGFGIGKKPLEDDWEMIRKAHCNGKKWNNKDSTEEVDDDDDEEEDDDNDDDEIYDNYESYEDSKEYENYDNYQDKPILRKIRNFKINAINSLFGKKF